MEQTVKIPRFLRKKNALVLIVVVIFLVIGVLSSVFVVDQTEEAVVLRLGQYNRTVGPGLQMKLPLGIEVNENVPTQIIQNISFGFRTERPGITTVFSNVDFPEESIMLTGDLNIVDVEWIIQYRIEDPKAWLFNVEDNYTTIRDISQSVINQLVGDRAIIDVLSDQRPDIEFYGQEVMDEIFDNYKIGVRVTAVRLQNIVPPSGRVQDAFEDVNRSVQDMNRLINEGREAYNKDIPRARGEAAQLIQIAAGYAAERVNRAEGDADRFLSVLAQYNQDPDTTRTRLYYEVLEEVLANQNNTRILDRDIETAIPFLNLLPSTSVSGGTE